MSVPRRTATCHATWCRPQAAATPATAARRRGRLLLSDAQAPSAVPLQMWRGADGAIGVIHIRNLDATARPRGTSVQHSHTSGCGMRPMRHRTSRSTPPAVEAVAPRCLPRLSARTDALLALGELCADLLLHGGRRRVGRSAQRRRSARERTRHAHARGREEREAADLKLL